MKDNKFLQLILEQLDDPKKFLIIITVPLFIFIFLMLVLPGKEVSAGSSVGTTNNKKTVDNPKTDSSTVKLLPADYDLYGVIIEKQGMRFRKEPKEDSGKIDIIPYNTKVKILDASTGPIETIYGKSSRWFMIEYQGKQGWIFGAFVKRLDPKFKKLKVVSSDSSDFLSSRGRTSYDSKNAFDGNFRTVWGTKDKGKDEWLEAELDAESSITKLEISNGFSSNTKYWSENNRAKKLLVECMDGNKAYITATIYDIKVVQDIYLPNLFQCKKVRFKLKSLYYGTKPYIYITEINIFGNIN